MLDIMIRDNFLDNFDDFNLWLRQQEFKDVEEPTQKITYPDLFLDIPESIITEVQGKLSREVGHDIITPVAPPFCRLTSSSTSTAPHQTHNDSAMSDYTFLLYMQDGEGGTSILNHKEHDMSEGVTTQELVDVAIADANIYEAWDIVDMVEMKANRAVWYPSSYLHRAEPVQGFGEGSSDGRIAFIMFYDHV